MALNCIQRDGLGSGKGGDGDCEFLAEQRETERVEDGMVFVWGVA
jgi:hypothetical protein